jgi:hypothetical protein
LKGNIMKKLALTGIVLGAAMTMGVAQAEPMKPSDAQPMKLSDAQMDQVSAGDAQALGFAAAAAAGFNFAGAATAVKVIALDGAFSQAQSLSQAEALAF